MKHIIYDSTWFTGTGPDFPDRELHSDKDEQCKAIMLRFGVTEFLTEPAPSAGNVASGQADITGYLYKLHPSRWWMFIRWDHSRNPAYNGFALWAWPKRTHDHDAFAKEVAEWFGRFHIPESGPLTIKDRGPLDPGAYAPGN